MKEPKLREKLNKVYEECKILNWEGYGALPVPIGNYLAAEKFINNLPAKLPLPEVSAEPDGEISFEWYVNRNHSLSVSINAQGRLAYASISGSQKKYGQFLFTNEFPKGLVKMLSQLHKNAKSPPALDAPA